MSLSIAEEIETVAGRVTVYRAKNSVNGRERYVIHFLAVPFRNRRDGEDYFAFHNAHYRHAIETLGGKRFSNKQFGGGVIFSTFTLQQDIKTAFSVSYRDALLANVEMAGA